MLILASGNIQRDTSLFSIKSETEEPTSGNTEGRGRKHKLPMDNSASNPKIDRNAKVITSNRLCQILQADCGKAGNREGNTLIQT